MPEQHLPGRKLLLLDTSSVVNLEVVGLLKLLS
jgi:hypothetical protein